MEISQTLTEAGDSSRFPPFLRRRVQDALLQAWHASPPIISQSSPADECADILFDAFNAEPILVTFVDFCAGSGGPTPCIEAKWNTWAENLGHPKCDFVLTDLHPNPEAWEHAKKKSRMGHLRHWPDPVDASGVNRKVLQDLVHGNSGEEEDNKLDPGRIVRLFNLAFHHFDDCLAQRILQNCVDTDTPFFIFELQDRSWESFLNVIMFGIGVILSAAYFAWKWRSPATFIFTYLIPILPLVLVFDGFISCLRTRTPQEIESLLRSLQSDEKHDWVIKSGRQKFMWPCGYLNYVVGSRHLR